MYALFKDGEIITAPYHYLGTLKLADKLGVLMHFGDVEKGVLAVGYEIKELKAGE